MKVRVESSNIEFLDWQNKKLTYYFKNGVIVDYLDVPEGIYAGLLSSDSIGTFSWRYIANKFTRVVRQKSNITIQNKQLTQHKDLTVGLWSTDKPEKIPDEIKKYFFEITYEETPNKT